MDAYPAPRIVPRAEHSLSRKLIDADALKVLYRLHNHGFKAYLVGGCVRDLLLGKTPKDFDVATDAHPHQVRKLFRNCRLVGRRFRLAHVYFRGGKIIEVSTFRRRSEFAPDRNIPENNNSFGTPAEDAHRRDITINGIFYNLADFSLIDYVGGLEDLRQGLIRCIGDAEEKFTSDPVRMMRVIRHAARTGFAIEEKTYQSLVRQVSKLSLCSPVRVRDEFLRELKEGSAQASVRLMIETGLLFVLFPSLILPLSENGRQELLLRILQTLDHFISSGRKASDDFCLAFFLSPFTDYFCPQEKFPPGRAGQVLYQQKIKEWISETLGPWEFNEQIKDQVSRLHSMQRICRSFAEGEKIPFRLRSRRFFNQALKLYNLINFPQIY
ncbi:MAG: polynucleotide adenylyltransferase PcnB [Thermodesulfobacteriota bacterium]